MKTDASTVDVSVSAQVAASATWQRLAAFMALTKPRLNLLVLMTTLGGIYLAQPDGVPLDLLIHTMVGTALVAGGAAALNHVLERDTDALMRRTRRRPLPGGRLGTAEAAWFGITISLVGLLELWVFANGTAALAALATHVSYVLVYTPLKRRTSLSTLVGGIPGGLPPVIGWAAATGEIGVPALTLFLIVFLWQMPHFLALAWICRDDYAAAGMPMLPVIEPDGRRTGLQSLLYSAVLLPVSLMPTLLGITQRRYLLTATVLGVVGIVIASSFARQRTRATARRVFLYSIVYLPLLWTALIVDRLWP